MSSKHSFGKPLNIFQFSEENIQFDEVELNNLLLHPHVKSRKIIVFTIVGAFRKGKSFFLDYCLRFAYSNVSFLFFSIVIHSEDDVSGFL
jgi:hypothetical protein